MGNNRRKTVYFFPFTTIFIIILLLVPWTDRVQDYHNRNVSIEYKNWAFSNDTLDFSFYAPGSYSVRFSNTPGHINNEQLPENFTIEVSTGTPIIKHLEQSHYPSYFDITITSPDGKSETHSY